jgi:hypothetical protein
MRLPLLLPTDLTAEQRPMYDSFEYSGFEVRNPEGAYIGPWGVFLQFPELSKPPVGSAACWRNSARMRSAAARLTPSRTSRDFLCLATTLGDI